MKKIVLSFPIIAALCTIAAPAGAEVFMDPETCGVGMGCGMAGGGNFLVMSLVAFIYFALASFIFSAIFWLVHKWLIKK